jgi:hypothetical protein
MTFQTTPKDLAKSLHVLVKTLQKAQTLLDDGQNAAAYEALSALEDQADDVALCRDILLGDIWIVS